MAEEAHGSGHVAPTEALLFVLTCILLGLAVQVFVLKRIRLPYTAILLVIGLVIGLLQAAGPKTEQFTATLSLWMRIDPHLLLLIFLPTIGFSAAIAQEPHLLRRNWGQILLLAGPGVVVTFLLIAICAKCFFPYGWTWPEALLFGAMLSATDPVAVVAVLHEVGADEKLANVIDGESLVNDGSALVVFLVLQQFVQGAQLSPGEIVVLFLRLALLGAAVGLAFGLVTSLWLSRLTGEPGAAIVLSFGAAYACYFVSEELVGASGLLAVVSMGFSMSLIGGRHITSRIQVEMHAFWEALEWLANTMLFIWVGIALGFVLLPPTDPLLRFEVEFAHHLRPADAGYVIVLYLWLLVARAVAIGVLFPLLRTGRVGYAMTWRTAAVMVWAGLRGAVGVAMSLFILLDPLIKQDEYKAHCVMFMAVMAFLTVLINGSTTKHLLTGLGLLKMTPQQEEVLGHVMNEMEEITAKRLQTVEPDAVLGAPDLQAVKAWTGTAGLLGGHGSYNSRFGSKIRASGRRSAASKKAAQAATEGVSLQRLAVEYRRRLLAMVKASYGAMYTRFELLTAQVSFLQEATDKAVDTLIVSSSSTSSSSAKDASRHDPEAGPAGSAGLADWRFLRARLEASGRWASRSACLAQRLSRRQTGDQLQLVSAFVSAHTAAQSLMATHLSQLDAASSESRESGAAVVDRQAVQIVLQESRAEVAAAIEYAQQVLLPRFPDLAPLLMSKQVALSVLEEQQAFLASIEAAGLLRGEELHAVQQKVEHKLEVLSHLTAASTAASADASQPAAASAAASPAGAGEAAAGAAEPAQQSQPGDAGGFSEAPTLNYLSSLHNMAPGGALPLARGSVGLARGSIGLRRATLTGR